jgi:hypothetical protein
MTDGATPMSGIGVDLYSKRSSQKLTPLSSDFFDDIFSYLPSQH